MNDENNIEILDSLEIAEKLNVGTRFIVLECKVCHRHFGIFINFRKIKEVDMTCRNCNQNKKCR